MTGIEELVDPPAVATTTMAAQTAAATATTAPPRAQLLQEVMPSLCVRGMSPA